MFVVANRVPVAPDWAEQFEERFRKRTGQVEKQTGFVRMEILKPVSKDTPYVVLTAWESQAAFLAWLKSDDFKLAHSNPIPKEAFSGEGRLEQYEVVITAMRE
jgi:heme-degrading monooxygenase HmoA